MCWEPVEYLLPKGRSLAVNEGDMIRKGDLLLDGSPVPHDILNILGVEALAEYLVKEIQDVYRLQGVKINDKHIETIVRQMLQKVEIEDSGETTMLAGEQVEREEFARVNAQAEEEGIQPAKARPVLLGITKASLQTRSFVSAASFQGNHKGSDRGVCFRTRGQARRFEGKCHCRASDSRGYRFCD